MNITIKDCNNITNGNITIEKNKLNIKYGMNGTGKSTIALATERNNDLSFLKTFGSTEEPCIELKRKLNNETYISISQEEINLGILFIRKFITDFDYIQVLNEYYTKDNKRIKIQIYV